MCQESKIILLTVAVIFVINGSSIKCEDFKLPDKVLPTKYQLDFALSIENEELEFVSNVKISIKVLEDTDEIVIHSAGLKISEINIWDTDESEIKQMNLDHESIEDKDAIKILTPNLKANYSYLLQIKYGGCLHKKFIKFYETSEKLFFAAILFQSKFRNFCPSFDEDNIRTVFEISVHANKSFRAVSNSYTTERTKVDDKLYETKFRPTEPLPTTSITVFVSNFESYVFTKTHTIEIIQPFDVIDSKNLMDMSMDVIEAYNNLFESIYSLDTMKLIMMPNIVSEIVSNELVFFNQYQLNNQQYDIKTAQRDKMLRYLTKTFAQQYFGNILSMANEHETFLTDGFAKYYEFLIANDLNSKNQVMRVYYADTLLNALEQDSLLTTENLINIKGDGINQLKSVKFLSILKMYADHIGEAFFDKTLEFLLKYKFKSITVYDFYKDFVSEPMVRFFKSWVENSGYPVVRVINRTSSSITLQQKKFSLYPRISATSTTTEVSVVPLNLEQSIDPTWEIPITYYTSKKISNKDTHLMKSENEELAIPESDWIILNNHQTGFYRVNYDQDSWKNFISILNSNKYTTISVLNRAALLNDALNLALAGEICYKIAFDLLSYLRFESDITPWNAVHDGLQHLDSMLSTDEQTYQQFKKFIIQTVAPLYFTIDLAVTPNESKFTKELRHIAMFWMCKMESPNCLNFVNVHLWAFLGNSSSIHKNLHFPILCNAIRGANFEIFKKVFEYMTKHEENRNVLIEALACTEDAESMLHLLGMYFEEDVSSSDKRSILTSLVENYKWGAQAAIDIITRRLIVLEDSEINFMLNAMVKRIWNEDLYTLFNSIIKELMTSTKITQEQVINYNYMAGMNANFMHRHGELIQEWLIENVRNWTVTSTTKRPNTDDNNTTESVETTTAPDGADSLRFRSDIFLLIIPVIVYLNYI